MRAPSQVSASFARVVRKYRARKGPLAEAAEIHHTYVGLLERCKRKPTIEVAERIARALDRKLSTLIAEAERTSTK
jgi:transcriptional regulator with XRE-family HTH domain